MPRRAGWMMHFGDFANMLKAFIGSSYLGVAYAFSQSGLLLGIIGVIVIASLTDHCCHLIVKVKYYAMKQILAEQKEKRRISKSYEARGNRLDYSSFGSNGHLQAGRERNTVMEESVELEEIKTLEQHMLRHMSYGDIGRLSFGTKGLVLVNIFIAITQFCFCVGYFIFIGNTIHRLFPIIACENMTIVTEPHTPVSIRTTPSTFNFNNDPIHEDGLTGLEKVLDTMVESIATVTESPYLINTTVSPDSNVTAPWVTITPPYNLTTLLPAENVTTTTAPCIEKTTAPSLKYFVASPIPIFLIFALIRSIRKMSWISATANFSILGGCVAILIYLLVGFQINDRFEWVNVEGVAIFFGIVTAGFEGIGLVIPVEASMEGNRHNFGNFLHGVIAILSVILAMFGILGYLEFADGVQQMVNLNIQHGSISFYLVNVGVCFGVLLTFPLQIYPVIELIELILFSEGSIFGPKPLKSLAVEDDMESSQSLLGGVTDDIPICVAAHIPDSVAAWKRNIVRVIVVLLAAGLAVVFRNSFAYIGAFTGAVGSSALMYFLPCLFHIKLCRQDISILVVIKNILIMIFGVVASIISLYYVIRKLVHNTSV